MKISEKLKSRIKDILTSDPYDILREDDSIVVSTLELCSARDNKFKNIIGSANLHIAGELVNFELSQHTDSELSDDDYEEEFDEVWSTFIDSLKQERFIKDTPETIRENFHLVVNND